MQTIEIENKYHHINGLLANRRVGEAIAQLGIALQQQLMTDQLDHLNELEETYQNMLRYTVRLGIKDPRRQQIYNILVRDLFELSDHLRYKGLFQSSFHQSIAGIGVRDLSPAKSSLEICGTIDNIFLQTRLDEIMQKPGKGENTDPEPNERNKLITRLFKLLISVGKLAQDDIKHVNRIMQSEELFWFEKSVLISAITLGLFNGFDEGRFDLLFDTYVYGEVQVSQRAFAGLMLGLHLYDHRLPFYPQIENRLKAMQGDESLERDSLMVLRQITKAKDTEKVSRKFREEIMPDIMKQAPRIEDKLGLYQILPDDPEGEKNPKWQTLFEDAPDLIQRMEEITRLQLEGMDVFINTFAHLKHFPFFRQLHNWFLPFYKHHPAVGEAMQGEDTRSESIFIDGLEKTNYICNSDKYSFCFSVQTLPAQQKEALIHMFAAEVEGMNEMASEENLLDVHGQINSIYTQYIQDLYRFYKLFPAKTDFNDIFVKKLDFHNKEFFGLLMSSDSGLRSAGDFYFDRDHFDSAIEVYEKLLKHDANQPEIFEKIAYSNERLGNTLQALNFYRKAELFETNRAWNLRRMANCYLKLNELDEAMACFQESLLLEPHNQQAQISIANCFLKMKNYDEALNRYYKIELENSDNMKIIRPIAWCLFITGKIEEAKHNYEKLLSVDANRFDYMNLGHVNWCLGKRNEAIENYLESLNQKDNTPELFATAFMEDLPYLEANGVDISEMELLLDYILINSRKPV